MQARFLDVVEFVEDEELKKKLVEDYNTWWVTKDAKDFWKRRNLEAKQQGQSGSSSSPITTTATSIATAETIISLEDARAIIARDVTPAANYNRYSNCLWRFKYYVCE